VCICGRHDGPVHHLSCPTTCGLRTKRHNAIVDALKEGIESFTSPNQNSNLSAVSTAFQGNSTTTTTAAPSISVKKEVQIAQGLVADLLVDLGQGKWKAIDVAIIAPGNDPVPEPSTLPDVSSWPTHLKDSPDGPTTPRHVNPNNEVTQHKHPFQQLTSFRRDVFESSIGYSIGRWEHKKRLHYKQLNPATTTLSPFVITAGGSIGGEATGLWNFFKSHAKLAYNGHSKMRFICSRIGIILLKYNTSIAQAKAAY
jgi:hypothetical protein